MNPVLHSCYSEHINVFSVAIVRNWAHLRILFGTFFGTPVKYNWTNEKYKCKMTGLTKHFCTSSIGAIQSTDKNTKRQIDKAFLYTYNWTYIQNTNTK